MLVLMMASGLCWEVYEVIAPWQTIYPTGDALSDIVVNVLGWALVAIVHPYVLGDLPASVETRLAEFSTDTVSVGRFD